MDNNEKYALDNNKPPNSSSSFVTKGKNAKEKKPRNDDEPPNLSLSFTTQEKPIEDDNKLRGSFSSCAIQEKQT
jgi:hypothetical protein